jgi:hypothetical protein
MMLLKLKRSNNCRRRARFSSFRRLFSIARATACANSSSEKGLGRIRFLELVQSFLTRGATGERIKRGPITKTDKRHVRRLLTEAGWAYRLRARISRPLLKPQEGLP